MRSWDVIVAMIQEENLGALGMRLETRSRALWKGGFSSGAISWANSYFLVQILRLLNTNVDGKQKVMYALTKIKGVGRRYSNLVCKKADVDLNKRYANTPIYVCGFGF
jgi:hypothetical protein